MKIKTILSTLCLSLGLLFAAHAQDAGRLSINRSSVPLSQMITEIESQTDYTFFVNDGRIDVGRSVSLSVSNASLQETLDKLFTSTPYSWAITGKQIVLSIKPTTVPETQSRTVTGRVTDSDNGALAGAMVAQSGTSNAVLTDANGAYTITMGPGSGNLDVSLFGYAAQSVAVAGRQRVDVVLQEGAHQIDEVVVLGYGTAHAREVTSSITQISGSALTAGIGGATIVTALQGKIPGLVISQTASPNAGSTLQLRGIGSYNASQQPLVVIDGIPGGSLNAIDQNDIETITVLKDASAGAIYGTRAAAGVVLVTTKKAKAGTITARYIGEFSTETARRIPDLLSHEEYLDTGRGQDFGGRDDWYRSMMRDAPLSHKHTVNIMGGSDRASVYASMGYSDQKGISIGDGRKDYFGRVNSNFRFWDGIAELRVNLNYRQIDRDYRNGESLGANLKNMYTMAMILNPTIPIYYDGDPTGYNQMRSYVDANGETFSLGMDTDFWNHIANIENRTNRNLDNYLQADATLKINITPKLSVQGTFGHQGYNRQITTYRNNKSRQAIEGGYNGYAYHSYARTSRVSTEAYANYNNSFGGGLHRVDATAGWSFLETNGENFNASNSDFPVDGSALWNFGGGAALNDLARRNGGVGMGSGKDIRNRLLGIFARANYSYDDRYMVTASIRRDANSTFGRNNKWGTFWALSGGWRISNEKFMEGATWVNDLKLRVGYGVVGNAPGTGQSRFYYSPDGTSQWIAPDGLWYVSYGPNRNQNPNLKWEESHSLNIGIDYSLFDNRLYGNLDFFQRNVKDMLYNQNVAMPPYVFTTTLSNIGTLRGTGWEFSIGGDVVRTRNITYSTTLRASHDKTKLTDLGNVENIDRQGFPSPGSPGSAIRYVNGSTIGKFWVFKNAGLDENGRWLIELPETGEVVPYTGNSAVTNKHWVGNAIPKVILSWDHNFRYKNLDFGLNLRSWIGHDVYNMQDMYFGVAAMSGGYNLLKSSLGKNKDIKQTGVLTDWFIEKGTFLKVDAIYLGYTLNTAQWIKYLQSARFYMTVRDAFVFTSYTGMNPEVTITGLSPGFDSDTVGYPQLTRFTFGVELTF